MTGGKMKYLINDKEFSGAECAAAYITEAIDYDNLTALYQERLDTVYGEIDVCGYTKSASFALERADPAAFRRGVTDFKETMRPRLVSLFESMDIDNEEFCHGFIVVALAGYRC